MRKSWWPVWFPYPSSWRRAIVLFVLICLLGTGLKVFKLTEFFFYQAAVGNLTLYVSCSFVVLTFCFVFATYLHHFVVNGGKSPTGWFRGLPSPKSISKGFFALNVLILTSIIISPIIMSFCGSSSCEDISDGKAGLIPIIWITLLAYFYQAEYLVTSFSTKHSDDSAPSPKPSGKSAPSTKKLPPAPAENLDAEIEQMRREMGLK